MKNKKFNRKKIFTILFSALVLILLIVVVLLITNKIDKFNFNEDNFSVQIMEYNLFFDTEEDARLFIVEVDNNNYHIIDKENEYYFIDNEIIESLERKRDKKKIWIYEKDKSANTVTSIYGFTHKEFVENSKQLSIDIINEINNSNYKKEYNIYNVKVDDKLKNNINNIIKNKWSSSVLRFDYNDYGFYSDCADCYEVYEVKDVEFKVNNSNIEELKIELTNVVYDGNGKINKTFSYSKYEDIALVFKFSNYGNTSVELSDDIKQSLANTQASDFVGNYVHTKNCSDGKSYDETIELTNKFDFIFGSGWDAYYEIFDCEDNSYVTTFVDYVIENEIITFYKSDDEVVKFKYENAKLSELDENNNVISVFNKE